jgi:formylglycine-generating enzyme required for sulfatase activity
MNRPLRVFLCHSSNDKPAVRELCQKLRAKPWIQPWLDEEELFPGMDWNLEIEKAIEATDVILVCLSNNSITKEGYVQREIRIALDYADYKPEGTLFIIPVRLEDCTPPKRLARWQYVDYFPKPKRKLAFQKLLVSFKDRGDSLSLKNKKSSIKAIEKTIAKERLHKVKENSNAKKETKTLLQSQDIKATTDKKVKQIKHKKLATRTMNIKQSLNLTPDWIANNKITLSNGMEFMRILAGKFWMGSKRNNNWGDKDEYPRHIVDIPFDYWLARYPITNEQFNVYASTNGIKHPVDSWEKKKEHPVVSVKWTEVIEYCLWLNDLLKTELSSGLVLRLPTEAEWEKAARGTDEREFPWGNDFDKNKCNTSEAGKGNTTPVGFYSPQGDSPYSCRDMSGNVWEWTHSIYKEYPYMLNYVREYEKGSGSRVRRGGSFIYFNQAARCASRRDAVISYFQNDLGFRICLAPPLIK